MVRWWWIVKDSRPGAAFFAGWEKKHEAAPQSAVAHTPGKYSPALPVLATHVGANVPP